MMTIKELEAQELKLIEFRTQLVALSLPPYSMIGEQVKRMIERLSMRIDTIRHKAITKARAVDAEKATLLIDDIEKYLGSITNE